MDERIIVIKILEAYNTMIQHTRLYGAKNVRMSENIYNAILNNFLQLDTTEKRSTTDCDKKTLYGMDVIIDNESDDLIILEGFVTKEMDFLHSTGNIDIIHSTRIRIENTDNLGWIIGKPEDNFDIY